MDGDDAAPITHIFAWDGEENPLLDDRRAPFGDGSGDEVRPWSGVWEGGQLIRSHGEAPFVGERGTDWFWTEGRPAERLAGRLEVLGDEISARMAG